MLVMQLLAIAAAFQGTQDFHWSGTLAAGKTIEIKGVNGDIRAVAATGNAVEVRASKRARRSDPESVELRVVTGADGVTICAVYPSRRRANTCEAGDGGQSSDNNDVVVNFEVYVPAGVQFTGRTVNGSVSATGLRADAYASTVNGSVEVETTGEAEAQTVNGDVRVDMGRIGGSGPMHFSTVNGRVDVSIPESAALTVSASTTNGDISTDFPLTVRGRFGPRHLSGTIGGGGRSISLETVNGDIALHKGS
jgi:DUF4097 and DUF4098 domain-containing protein YvlB